jgi:hypothetical protein
MMFSIFPLHLSREKRRRYLYARYTCKHALLTRQAPLSGVWSLVHRASQLRPGWQQCDCVLI